MPKYEVDAREIVYYTIEVDAEIAREKKIQP